MADARKPRHPKALKYSVACCLFTGILLFLCRLGARRQIALRLNTSAAARLFNTLFGASKVPHGDTIRDLFAQLDVAEVEEALLRFVEILIDHKVLYPWRLLDTYYVVALDATGPVFETGRRYGWKFLIGLSDGQLTSVNEEFHALVAMHPENALTRTMGERGPIRQDFAWANDIAYQDTCKRIHTLDVLQCRETKPQNEETTTFRWVVNLHVEAHNAAHLANNGARLRWKTENEVFNVQKNNGFALEHAYANDENAAKIFHVLLQFAFILHQLIQHGSLFRNPFPHGFGSAKNLAAEILEAVRRIGMSTQDFNRILAQRIQIRFPVRPPTHTLAAQTYVPPYEDRASAEPQKAKPPSRPHARTRRSIQPTIQQPIASSQRGPLPRLRPPASPARSRAELWRLPGAPAPCWGMALHCCADPQPSHRLTE